METFVQKAVERGLSEICFLDHLTLAKEGASLSMSPGEVGLYFHAVKRLAARWHGKIEVKAGLEVDFAQGGMDIERRVVDTYAFDIIACSVHFLNGFNIVSKRTQKDNPYKDPRNMARDYLASLDSMLDNPFFDMVGHLDVVKKFSGVGEEGLEQEWEAVIRRLARLGLAVEVNTSGFFHAAKEQYPSRRLLKLCREAGVEAVLSSDAHSPGEVGREFARARAVLAEAGYTRLVSHTRRRKEVVSLEAP
jgi:histidinol-phosphatase (PHP family)